MISYIYGLFEYFFPKNSIEDEEEDQNFLAEQILNLEINEENKADVNPNDDQVEVSVASCFQRTGTVTFMDDSYILINGRLFFDTTTTTIDIHVNDRVTFLGYKDDEDIIKVVRLLNNLGPAWGDEDTEESKYQVIEHVIVAEVEERRDRLVYMKDSDVRFSLDDVEATFVPIKGDWLELMCTVQWDDSKPTDIGTAQVLKVQCLRALRTSMKSAKVTLWDGASGRCDNNIYFDIQSLQNGSVEPVVGMKVILQAIESTQGTCCWRAITVLLDETSLGNTKDNETMASQPNEEIISMEKEKQLNITVTHPIHFEQVQIHSRPNIYLDIENKSQRTQTLNKWLIVGNRKDSQVNIKPFLSQPTKIDPGQKFSFNVTCNPKFLGKTRELLVLNFKGFQFKRFIDIEIVDNFYENKENGYQNGYHNGRSENDLKNSMRNVRQNKDSYVPGTKPLRAPNFVRVRLGRFPIPEKVWAAVLGDSEQTIYTKDYNDILNRIESFYPFLVDDLNINNYRDKWHTLLYIEEVQQNISMRKFDLTKTFLIPYQEYLSIEIAGLSEKRPSLMIGDKVYVKDIWDNQGEKYEGFIHLVKGDTILIKFHPRFQENYSGGDVSIHFEASNGNFRKAHYAVNLALSNLGPELVFPSRVSTKPSQISEEVLNNIEWFNEKLNAGQQAAVRNILKGECRPMPYCIYGPPGTGKTITVIETILQIMKQLPHSRILVATPSNSAANLVTERLLQYKDRISGSVTRLIANHLIGSESIPNIIKPYCATLDIATENTAPSKFQVNDDGIRLNCPSSVIGRHRVTIGTCSCVGTLNQLGLPRGHFTHVIVDEAGQAIEPEIMIPMTFTDKEHGQIILAGDPMQLGPVVMSRYATEYGMGESYLSRLLDRFPYQKDYHAYIGGYDQRLVTKLVDNYRSLDEVLHLPSLLFYDNNLVPKIDRNQEWIKRDIETTAHLFHSDKSKGGIFVYGIRGVNARAEDSPSWYNPQEASMVALTTCKLFKKGISPDDIGIITPYIAQVKHLRTVFDAMGLPQPKIASVEEFQGQERPIILISTVRSSESYIVDDVKHTLGFVQNPRRLNVALTRAQVAVILFCNPHLLSLDQLWQKVVLDAVNNDRYMGCDLPKNLQPDKVSDE